MPANDRSSIKVIGKVNILDRSVLIHDPLVIERLGANTSVIPIWVIEQLDVLKNGTSQQAMNAREASRLIESYRNHHPASLRQGVTTKSGGLLIVDHPDQHLHREVKAELARDNVDNWVIFTAVIWQKIDSFDVRILSKDVNLRIKADVLGIPADDWQHGRRISQIDELPSGVTTINLTDSQAQLISQLHQQKEVPADLLADVIDQTVLFPNVGCILQFGDKKALALHQDGKFKLVAKNPDISGRSIKPINDEQSLAWKMLTDQTIPIVCLIGKTGSGKTMLALLAALHQNDCYHQILVWRPTTEITETLGFLPGELDEKFLPFKGPIIDQLRFICGRHERDSEKGRHDPVQSLLDPDQGIIAIEPPNYVLGTTKHETFIIVDEAQNLMPSALQALVTRCGQGSKVVVTGDLNQIHARNLDFRSSGLTDLVMALEGERLFGHITLPRCERSEVARLCADKLNR